MPRLRQLMIVIMTLIATGVATAKDFDEGIEYVRIKPSVPTTSTGKIEVVEMFWYGCPHCFQFEPYLHKWLKKKPANVEFVRIPATFYPLWKLHARAYYTAEVLGVLDKLHKPMFEAYHLKKNRLDSAKALRKVFAKHGVKGSDFDDVFHSFAVETKLARAVDLTQRYGISGVPSMIVNGKYRTSNKISGHSNMLEVIDFLIRKESKRH